MEDLFYLSLMAASAPKLIYEGASHFKWEPEGRREVYDSDNEELERLYVETEEYFQQIEQREYEISQKVGSPAAPWAQIEKKKFYLTLLNTQGIEADYRLWK